jgi:hypothetical protein
LGIGVPECSLLNHNLAESRTLPDSAVIPTSEISDAAISLNEIFFNSELAGEGKLGVNQSDQRAKFPDREMIGIFLPRRDQKVRSA